MTSNPDISVIIPHFNHPEALAKCLDSLLAQTMIQERFEIIVVDNGSEHMPTEVVESYESTRLLQEKEPGPGPARNLGAASARADILAFIDADCLAHENWLSTIESHFATNAEHAILGGDVLIAYDVPENITGLEAYESVYAYRMKEYITKQGFTGTGNLAVRKDVFQKVGAFAGIGIAEDRDWGQRATALGHATHYATGMIVFHPARKSFEELKAKWDRHTSHDYARERSKSFGAARWVFRTALVTVSPLPEILRIIRSERLSRFADRWKAFRVLCAIRWYRARTMIGLLLGTQQQEGHGDWDRSS